MTTAPTRTRVSAPARILMAPVHAWRVVSSRLPQRCRFHPSCSAYALGALETHGAARGTWLALRRLGRCHPWHPGGIDAVPLRTGNTRSPVGSMRPRPRPSEGRQ